eukprot:m.85032 g.85032  ORF g.85032 m.85032 type:complete len:120 (+) comp12769_c0_seq2:682-1041(+)
MTDVSQHMLAADLSLRFTIASNVNFNGADVRVVLSCEAGYSIVISDGTGGTGDNTYSPAVTLLGSSSVPSTLDTGFYSFASADFLSEMADCIAFDDWSLSVDNNGPGEIRVTTVQLNGS